MARAVQAAKLRRVLVIQGHPDGASPHLCHALADTYAEAAAAAGHLVRRLDVQGLDFPLLRSQRDWEEGELPESLSAAQDDVVWADHVVLVFPLWLGGMPALVKGFLEQLCRPGFAFIRGPDGKGFGEKGLAGRSARLVVTMGMPALVYRWYFMAHSIRALERNILGFVGIGPIARTLVGSIATLKPDRASRLLKQMRDLGARAA